MSKKIYFQQPNHVNLLTEYEVKARKMDKSGLKKHKLSKHQVFKTEEVGITMDSFVLACDFLGDLSAKDIERKATRKDLMRLGLVW